MRNDYSTRTINEVAEILEHIPKELYDRTPGDIIDYFYQNSDSPSENPNGFVYNVALPIMEQEIGEETKEVIAYLSREYWSK